MSKSDYEDRVQAIRRAEDEGSFPIPEFEQNPREALEFFRQAALDRRDEVKYDVINHITAYTFAEPVTMAVMLTALSKMHDREILSHACQDILIEWTCEPDRDYRGYPSLVLDMLRLVKRDLRKVVDDGMTLGEFIISPGVFKQIIEVLLSGEDFGKKVLYAAADRLCENSDTDSTEHLAIITELLALHPDPKVVAIYETYYSWLATRDPLNEFLAPVEARWRGQGLPEKEIRERVKRLTVMWRAMNGAWDAVKRDLDSQNDLPDEDED